jgi:hypothetical protein
LAGKYRIFNLKEEIKYYLQSKGGDFVNLHLNSKDVLNVLGALQNEYVSKKKYFKENPNETVGLTTPEELKNTYNDIIGQMHEIGELAVLDKIDNEV